MTNPAAQIAEHVATELTDAGLSQDVTAIRRYVVDFELRDLAGLKVSVVPRSWASQRMDRLTDRIDVEIDIAVQQRCDPGDLAAVDALMDLMREIEAHLNRLDFETSPPAHWVGSQIDPLYAADLLHEQRVFTSVLTLTYRLLGDA